MLTIKINPFPLPKTQKDLKLAFRWEYCEEDSGRIPAAFSHILAGLPMEVHLVEDDGSVVYTGSPSPHSKPVTNLAITGHMHGLFMTLIVLNKSEVINGDHYWRTFISHDDMTNLIAAAPKGDDGTIFVTVNGSCPCVPHTKSVADAVLNLEKKWGKYFLKNVSFDVSSNYWNSWRDVKCSEQEIWEEGLMELQKR